MDFNELDKKQKTSLIIAAALILLLTLYVCFQFIKTNYVVLYQDQNLANISSVTEHLKTEGIDFKLSNFGSEVLVSEDNIDQLKIDLAQQEQIATKAPGFELFDNVDYSMTEHAQKITFQRAMQGELEFTLKSYQEIDEARVHLTLPKKRLFSNDNTQVKASVSLWIMEQAVFSQEQVIGVQELLSASVEGLQVENVVVLDGSGRQMSSSDNITTNSKALFNYNQEMEQILSEKAGRLLALYFNAAQFAISVTVDVDHSQQKHTTREILVNDNNEGTISRKKESVVSTPSNSKKAQLKEQNKNVEIEYEHGLEVAERVIMPGSIDKVSVAIAISANVDESLSNKINKLVYAGLGLNSDRGDAISVEIFPIVTKPPVMIKPDVNTFKPAVISSATNNITKENEFDIYSIPLWLIISICIFILFVVFMIFAFKGKRLTTENKEHLQLEFNEWLNVKEDSVHVTKA